jgi:hypothetical protein
MKTRYRSDIAILAGSALVGLAVCFLAFNGLSLCAYRAGRGTLPFSLAALWLIGLLVPVIPPLTLFFAQRVMRAFTTRDTTNAVREYRFFLQVISLLVAYGLFFGAYGSGMGAFVRGVCDGGLLDSSRLQAWSAEVREANGVRSIRKTELPSFIRDIWKGAASHAIAYVDHVSVVFRRGVGYMELSIGSKGYEPDGPPKEGAQIRCADGIFILYGGNWPLISR